ncbi:hypothetical protein A3A95_01685 [Candidatus Nomurabacteria bacterium RIFCSPLOWO2_01_FULL_39_18]|uniref:Uncharacterized protein n=1 Tax=Candidatus Nomurabacteria bacterium RIFCSPHIGHO2_01_FULL_40_24b TaxID=1801739 RepID=A0A1F6V9I1_9BACT|nr:MAG: hypothetical protein A2647_01035 [Candidatus Nomurabacteria bacterium RIFCSPHIGHO2_01_FULL_40_24b]OGI90579.1 MAG: hypothetical protein A3A95_01685 [Candidatus Nomurabacteria bacterium RIFCSPLOWO2_01_FULL_39_18]
MNIFEKFTNRKSKTVEQDQKILPSDIRYALQYKKSLLNRIDIETLVRNNFENEALYLTFKSLTENPEQHRTLLEKCISCVLESGNDTKTQKNTLQKLILEALGNRNDIQVKGGKLAQLSRQGFDLWQDKFKLVASQLSDDDRNVFLVTNPMLIGLSSFVQAFSEKNKTLNIVVPAWLEKENMGYVVTFAGGKMNVEWLRKPFDKRDLVIIDDTRNTGDTLERIRDYFVKNGSQEPEMLDMDKMIT